MDYILRYEDTLHTEEEGYAVFYPNDGLLTQVGSLDSAVVHRDQLIKYFPDAYVVHVEIRKVVL